MVMILRKPTLIYRYNKTQITFILVKFSLILKMLEIFCNININSHPVYENCHSVAYLLFFSQTADWRSSRVYPQNVGKNFGSIRCLETECPENLRANNYARRILRNFKIKVDLLIFIDFADYPLLTNLRLQRIVEHARY